MKRSYFKYTLKYRILYYGNIRDCFIELEYYADTGSKIQVKNYPYDKYATS